MLQASQKARHCNWDCRSAIPRLGYWSRKRDRAQLGCPLYLSSRCETGRGKRDDCTQIDTEYRNCPLPGHRKGFASKGEAEHGRKDESFLDLSAPQPDSRSLLLCESRIFRRILGSGRGGHKNKEKSVFYYDAIRIRDFFYFDPNKFHAVTKLVPNPSIRV